MEATTNAAANTAASTTQPQTTIVKRFSMNLEGWYWLFQTSSLVLLLGTVGLGGLTILAGRELNKRQAAQLLKLETTLTEARTRQSATELQLEEVRQRQRPKTISRAQRDKFISLLSTAPKGGINVAVVTGDNRSANYAWAIAKMLADAGYPDASGRGVMTLLGASITTSEDVSVVLITTSVEAAPPYASAIQEALKRIDIDAPYIIPKPPAEMFKSGEITVVVTSG